MINPIAPHGPVQTDPSGVPASTRGQSGDPSFDDFLSDQPAKDTPSPIEDHSPPPNPDASPIEIPNHDPMTGIMPRPIRWKENKSTAAGATPGAGVLQPGVPLPPIDPQLLATTITLSPSWSPLAPPAQASEASATEAGSVQNAAPTQVSVPDSSGTNAVLASGTSPVPALGSGMIRRLKLDSATVSVDPAPTDTQASLTSAARQVAPTQGIPTASPDSMLSPDLLDAGQAITMPTGAVLPALPSAADSGIANLDQNLPLSTGTNTSASILATGTSLISGETSSPLPVNPDLSLSLPQTNPLEADADRVSTSTDGGLSPTVSLAETGLANANRATPPPPGTDFAAPVTDSRVIAPVAPPVVPVDNTPPSATMARDATVTFPGFNFQAELSAASTGRQAKIAGSSTFEIKSAKKLEPVKSQATDSERIISDNKSDGTPVARNEPVVTTALSTEEKESAASSPPKRGGTPAPGTPASSQAANGHSQSGETLVSFPVSGPAAVDRAAAPVAQTSTPDATAARQAVKVETLLQNTLSAGESVRPNGSDQIEMRVRLNGGQEDVTVKMQVVNDRMQVTFQTDSPELSKALEHGWQQFSANASQTSTLSMSEPKFESSSALSSPPMGQTDAQAFSSNQQNSRRQETPTTFADEGASSVASAPRQAGFATAATAAPAAAQTAARRWSGWA